MNLKKNSKLQKVYFDEEWDGLTYVLRLDKRKENDSSFVIPKEKFNWIKKTEAEYYKAQAYITDKLRINNLI